MKKILTVGLPLAAMVMPMFAAAQLGGPPSGTLPAPTITSLTGVGTFICTALDWIFYFLLIFAVLFVLLAAFKYLTAAGDPEKVKAASQQLLYAAIAVAVALLAKAIPLIAGSLLGIPVFQAC